jgi:hypothetical protein
LYQEFNRILNNGILLSKEAIPAIKNGKIQNSIKKTPYRVSI